MTKTDKRKIRTREDIEYEVSQKGARDTMILEVLLDIRDSLNK